MISRLLGGTRSNTGISIIGPERRDGPDGILVGSMVLGLRRAWGEQPEGVYYFWDQKLTDVLHIVRERAKKFDEFGGSRSGWKN
jgi:hypothetical protein